MSLAAKLPWNHRFAGGYPGLSSQPLPTDADAIDYLSRMAAADGAGVETGVAAAVDAFIKALKADSLWDAIGSSCLLSGPRTLAGALVPLKGDAPTSYGFCEGDFDREGLTGDGSTTYLDSGRASDTDPQDDIHASVYAIAAGANENDMYLGSTGSGSQIKIYRSAADFDFRLSTSVDSTESGAGTATGFIGAARSDGGSFEYRINSSTTLVDPSASLARGSENIGVFAQIRDGDTPNLYASAKLAFYSIGTSLDLAKLDSHINSYVTAIGAAV